MDKINEIWQLGFYPYNFAEKVEVGTVPSYGQVYTRLWIFFFYIEIQRLKEHLKLIVVEEYIKHNNDKDPSKT